MSIQRRRRDWEEEYCEQAFRNAKELALAVEEFRLGYRPSASGGPAKSVKRPTESQAIANLSHPVKAMIGDVEYKRPDLWLQVIRLTYAKFNGIKGQAFRLRMRGWHYIRACLHIHVSEASYSRYCSEVLQYALRLAYRYNLMPCVDKDLSCDTGDFRAF